MKKRTIEDVARAIETGCLTCITGVEKRKRRKLMGKRKGGRGSGGGRADENGKYRTKINPHKRGTIRRRGTKV